jgi:hypothetical protein
MAEIKRVVLKKVFVLRAALVGLYIGIIIGLLSAEIIYLLIYTLLYIAVPYNNYTKLYGFDSLAIINSDIIFNIALAIIGMCVVFFPLLLASIASFYNLLAKIGGALHLGLIEYKTKAKKK